MAPRNDEPSEDWQWQVKCPEIKMRSAHLLRSRDWVDCTFQFQTQTDAGDSKGSLDAHKLLLAMASPVFAAMFYGDVGKKDPVVIISDIDLPTFSSLLEYIYTEKVDFTDIEAALSLYEAADKYILVHLKKMCLNYIFQYVHPDIVCHVYEFACFYNENSLEKKCLEIITTKTQHILKSNSFRNADINTVKKIVSMDTLNINSEMDLCEAVLDYVSNYKKPHDGQLATQSSETTTKQGINNKQTSHEIDNCRPPENIAVIKTPEARQILHGIIENIRFLTLDPEELAKVCESSAILSDFEIRAISANRFHLNSTLEMPDGFSLIRQPRQITSATICYTVNASSMKANDVVFSPPCYVRNLAWRIRAKRIELGMNARLLEFRLDFMKENSSTVPENWSYDAEIELRLHTVNPNTKPILEKCEHRFCSDSYQNSNQDFYIVHLMPAAYIDWDQLIDPNNHFIKDDSFTMEIYFETECVQEY